ncbi:hypothetical protein CLM85_11290 [Streptomyces albidoflavus]|nr:hypothetical protein CLM85_11290 [Streptomyces albidoflavus]
MNTYWLEHAWLGDRVENGVVVDLVPPDAPGPVPVDEELGDGTRAGGGADPESSCCGADARRAGVRLAPRRRGRRGTAPPGRPLVSGHDGGTGASPLTSLKHAGPCAATASRSESGTSDRPRRWRRPTAATPSAGSFDPSMPLLATMPTGPRRRVTDVTG